MHSREPAFVSMVTASAINLTCPAQVGVRVTALRCGIERQLLAESSRLVVGCRPTGTTAQQASATSH